jgi:hypothetical protein
VSREVIARGDSKLYPGAALVAEVHGLKIKEILVPEVGVEPTRF